MKVLLQRVSQANVAVDQKQIASIGVGLLLFVGVVKSDRTENALKCAMKSADLRVFPDDGGKMNLSICQTAGEILVVSQFTLAANLQKGTRPSFDDAAEPEVARELIRVFCRSLMEKGLRVCEGQFGAHMDVSLVNDGPVTFSFER